MVNCEFEVGGGGQESNVLYDLYIVENVDIYGSPLTKHVFTI